MTHHPQKHPVRGREWAHPEGWRERTPQGALKEEDEVLLDASFGARVEVAPEEREGRKEGVKEAGSRRGRPES